MIEVLIGPANSGKTETLVARVTDAVAATRRGVHLVVPSAPAASVLRELLSEEVDSLPLEAVKTFPALYHTILDQSKTQRHSMTLIDRDHLLRLIIAELAQSDRLRYFGETAAMPGLVNSLGALIEELWRCAIAPQDFAHIAEMRGDKDRDIAQVFTRYAAALEALEAVDSESAGHAALLAIDKASEPRRWFSLIAVDGFDFLTAMQVRLLSTLAARGVEVLVSLTYDEARAIHYWQRPTIARLQAAGATFTPCATEPNSRIQIAAAALMNEQQAAEFIANRSFKDASTASEMTIISAPDRASEVRSVAREIKRLVIENQITLDEIAIVCRSLSFSAPQIDRIFDECAIPVTMDVPLAVTENPAVVALLRLLNLSGQTFSRRPCIEAWRSPYYDWSEFGLDEQAVDLLEAISLAENLTRGRG